MAQRALSPAFLPANGVDPLINTNPHTLLLELAADGVQVPAEARAWSAREVRHFVLRSGARPLLDSRDTRTLDEDHQSELTRAVDARPTQAAPALQRLGPSQEAATTKELWDRLRMPQESSHPAVSPLRQSKQLSTMTRPTLKPAQLFVTILKPLSPLEQTKVQRTLWVPDRAKGLFAPFEAISILDQIDGVATSAAHCLAPLGNAAPASLLSPGSIRLPAVAILSPGFGGSPAGHSGHHNVQTDVNNALGPLLGDFCFTSVRESDPPQHTSLPLPTLSRSCTTTRTGVEHHFALAATQLSAFSFGVGSSLLASPITPAEHAAAVPSVRTLLSPLEARMLTAVGVPIDLDENYHPSLSDCAPSYGTHAASVAEAGAAAPGDQPSLKLTNEPPAADGPSAFHATTVGTPSDAAAAPPMFFSYSRHDPSKVNAVPAMVAHSREEAEVWLSRQAIVEGGAAWQYRNHNSAALNASQTLTTAQRRPRSAGGQAWPGSAGHGRNLLRKTHGALLAAHAQWASHSAAMMQAAQAAQVATDAMHGSHAPLDATPIISAASARGSAAVACLLELRRRENEARAHVGAAVHAEFMGHQACMARTSGALALERRRDAAYRKADAKAAAGAREAAAEAAAADTKASRHAAAAAIASSWREGAGKAVPGASSSSSSSSSSSDVVRQLWAQLYEKGPIADPRYPPHLQPSNAQLRATGQLAAAAASGALRGAHRESWDPRLDRDNVRPGQTLQLAPGPPAAPPPGVIFALSELKPKGPMAWRPASAASARHSNRPLASEHARYPPRHASRDAGRATVDAHPAWGRRTAQPAPT
jgi:hypothetical protein